MTVLIVMLLINLLIYILYRSDELYKYVDNKVNNEKKYNVERRIFGYLIILPSFLLILFHLFFEYDFIIKILYIYLLAGIVIYNILYILKYYFFRNKYNNEINGSLLCSNETKFKYEFDFISNTISKDFIKYRKLYFIYVFLYFIIFIILITFLLVNADKRLINGHEIVYIMFIVLTFVPVIVFFGNMNYFVTGTQDTHIYNYQRTEKDNFINTEVTSLNRVIDKIEIIKSLKFEKATVSKEVYYINKNQKKMIIDYVYPINIENSFEFRSKVEGLMTLFDNNKYLDNNFTHILIVVSEVEKMQQDYYNYIKYPKTYKNTWIYPVFLDKESRKVHLYRGKSLYYLILVDHVTKILKKIFI